MNLLLIPGPTEDAIIASALERNSLQTPLITTDMVTDICCYPGFLLSILKLKISWFLWIIAAAAIYPP